MTNKFLNSLIETEKFADECLDQLKNNQSNSTTKATVVALQGNLGSGKTTFTQAVARALGIKERVTSPTFVIMKTYAISKKWQGLPLPWRRLVHIDCYRLEGKNDLIRLGWPKLIADSDNLILVEWPERVGNLLFSPSFQIIFEVVGADSRKITYG